MVAGSRLDADHGTFVELRQVGCTGVGAARPDTGADLVDEVLDTGALRVEIHPRGGDALLVEALARPVEGRLPDVRLATARAEAIPKDDL